MYKFLLKEKGFSSELLTFCLKTIFKSFFCQEDMDVILRLFQAVIGKDTAK